MSSVRAAILAALSEGFGNPSSAHGVGERARVLLETARRELAGLIGCPAEQLVFTSGGTEANNLVLASASAWARGVPHIVTTTTEHSSILRMCERLAEADVEVTYLPVDQGGRVPLDDLHRALKRATTLVSVQWVNNETGVVQPIEEIGRLCRDHGVAFHTDAAQAIGKLPMNVSEMPIDFLTLTAHKFHGPQGVGAIYARDIRMLRPQLFGGPQERGLRPGTENLPGIAGMGEAARIRRERLSEVLEHLRALRDRFERLILQRLAEVRVNGDVRHRVCNTSNLCFLGVDGEALVARLDKVGIRCSQSSACTNQRPEPSYVLRAIGLSEEEASSSVRFGFAETNRVEEVDWAVDQIVELCKDLRRFPAPMPQRAEAASS